jgi:2-amino-4-hydroxy-6-hydroxymethyldihydropteridine diphosphokinase
MSMTGVAARVVAFVGIGSNLGDARGNVQRAILRLEKLPDTRLAGQSSLFRTAPIDAGGDDYVNAVARIDTRLPAQQLLQELQAIEQEFGRERPYPNAPRTLDLDILLYGQQSIRTDALIVPHPRLTQRAFALIPLLQLDPLIAIPCKGAAHSFVPDVAGQAIQKL